MRVGVERISSGDLVQLATDVGPVPMNVGAVLLLDPSAGITVGDLEVAVCTRLAGVGRLRQRLVTVRPGLGRPYWLDDGTFDIHTHVSQATSPDAAGLDALLSVAVDEVTTPLPRDRPLWRALLVSAPTGRPVGIVVTLHHVVADGIGGLAVLGRLVDEAVQSPDHSAPPAGPAPAAAPRSRDLLADRAAELGRSAIALPGAVARAWLGHGELGRPGQLAPRSSLNATTGPRRQAQTVDVELAPLRAAGRARNATINDMLLVAVGTAMATTLHRRGESVRNLVVSVPITARASTTSADLGNQVGVMPVRVPVTGTLDARLARVSEVTRAQKSHARGASAVLVGPAFRLLARVGVFRWFVDRQRLVNSFLTNLPGPHQQLSLAGAPILAIVPITVTAGNVGVAFAALSYAGRLRVTVITDPDVVPETDELAAALKAELTAIAAS